MLYGGRGGAKTWGIAQALLVLGTQRPLRILCTRQFQNSIRESVHQVLKLQIGRLNLGNFYHVQDTIIRGANGTEFIFEGIHLNVGKIRSMEGIDLVWVEEAEKVTRESWKVLIPTIRKPGSEIWISFNPEFEDDPTYEDFVLAPPWDTVLIEINWRDNPWFPDVLDKERQDHKRRNPDTYDHVWEGQCLRWLEGAIYAEELKAAYAEKRIRRVKWDKYLPVYTAWDIGRTDDTSIWWYQLLPKEIHIIESYGRSGGSPSHFASQILGRQVQIDIVNGEVKVTKGPKIPELAHRRKYRYEKHNLPPDAKAKTLAAAGKSVQQQLGAALEGHVAIVPNLSREDGIMAARTTFARCWFDQDHCSTGLKALRKYRRELQSDGVSLRPNPLHDESSHFADAFRYLAVAWQDLMNPSADDGDHIDDAYGFGEEETEWKTA